MSWKEIPKPARIVLIIVVILLVLWAGANIYRLLRKPPNAHYVSAGGSLPDGWNKTQVTDDLFNAFSGVSFWGKYNAMKQFDDLNDNQMIAVYNDWNDRYATKSIFLGMGSYGTLTNTLNGERFLLGSDAGMEAVIMTDNLNRLQLT